MLGIPAEVTANAFACQNQGQATRLNTHICWDSSKCTPERYSTVRLNTWTKFSYICHPTVQSRILASNPDHSRVLSQASITSLHALSLALSIWTIASVVVTTTWGSRKKCRKYNFRLPWSPKHGKQRNLQSGREQLQRLREGLGCDKRGEGTGVLSLLQSAKQGTCSELQRLSAWD